MPLTSGLLARGGLQPRPSALPTTVTAAVRNESAKYATGVRRGPTTAERMAAGPRVLSQRDQGRQARNIQPIVLVDGGDRFRLACSYTTTRQDGGTER